MNGVKTFVTFSKKRNGFLHCGSAGCGEYCFLPPPSADYFYYIDYRVLSLLFLFYGSSCGLSQCGTI